MSDRPVIELYQVLPDAPDPVPAGRPAVMGLPTKALRYCPPVTAASELGWYVFPAVDMALRFDGQQTDWRLGDGPWRRLTPGEEAIPESWREHYLTRFPDVFATELPDDLPGLFNADPGAPNRVEMYTGVAVRTSPGWSVLVRSPANLPRRLDMVLFEGVVETGWWVSLVPTIMELTTPGAEVVLRRNRPLAQIQLVADSALFGRTEAVIGGIDDVPPDMWDMWLANRRRRTGEDRLGSYQRTSKEGRRDWLASEGQQP